MISMDAPVAASAVRFGADRGGEADRTGEYPGGRLKRRLAGLSAWLFGVGVAAVAAAQDFGDGAKFGQFKTAPKAPDAEDAAMAAQSADMIFGIHANTLFFVAAGAIAIFWFTVGGGRKAKLERPH